MNGQSALDILFLAPPSSPRVADTFSPYLGAAYILAYLREHGFSGEQFTTTDPIGANRCIIRALERRPRIVGFTVYNINYSQCQLLAHKIKRQRPETILLFGGPAASMYPEIILKNNPFVDVCVRHEGEETCLELVSRLADAGFDLARTPLSEIPGMSFQSVDGLIHTPDRLHSANDRPGRDNLDRFPSPYLTGVLNTAGAGVITARGCNQHCVYCNCASLSNRRIATHSVDRVIEELDRVSHLDRSSSVRIYDDAFTLIPSRAKEICRRIIDSRISPPLSCITRCDLADEESLSLMRDAGFVEIGFALESASPRVLREIGKVQPPGTRDDDGFERERGFIEAFRENVRLAKRTGIDRVFASIMIGLPGETPAEAMMTMELIRELSGSLDSYEHNPFQVIPGTPVWNTYERYGLTVEKGRNGIRQRTVHPFPAEDIPWAPGCGQIRILTDEQASITSSMSLLTSPKRPVQAFRTAVLHVDRIESAHVRWLQNNLAIAGDLKLIYSSKRHAERHHESNIDALSFYQSPVTNPIPYFISDQTAELTLINRHSAGASPKALTPTLMVMPVSRWLKMERKPSPHQCICHDTDEADSRALHEYLCRRQESEPADCFWLDQVNPYFTRLCRWQANFNKYVEVVLDDLKRLAGARHALQHLTGDECAALLALETDLKEEPALPGEKSGPDDDPRRFVWLDVDGETYMTPVKNQLFCSACTAFGVVAAIESAVRIALNAPYGSPRAAKLPLLSEAHVFFFSDGDHNCLTGWTVEDALQFCIDPGVAPPACCYYDFSQKKAVLNPSWKNKTTRISGYVTLTSPNEMKRWLATRGPLVAFITMPLDLIFYERGVYTHVMGKEVGGHCLCCVGYDDEKQAWLCKNSWGSNWGDHGYIWIGYGQCKTDHVMWGIDGLQRIFQREPLDQTLMPRFPILNRRKDWNGNQRKDEK